MNVISIAAKVKSTEVFFRNIYQSVLSTLKVLILSKFSIEIPKALGNNCIVLGNGPSFKSTFEKYKDILKSTPLMAVNNFATSEQYTELKPRYYILLDPGYFLHKTRHDVVATFSVIKNTSWDMTLYIPYMFKKDLDVKQIQKAKSSVNVVFYNYSIFKGFEPISFWFFRKGLAMPQFYNVLGPAIFMSVSMGYKNTWVVGADHTWIDNLIVDENNILRRRDVHFYDKDSKVNLIVDPVSGQNQNISQFFLALYVIFDSYYLVNRYAKSQRQNIFNASEFSYVDAFERKVMSELK